MANPEGIRPERLTVDRQPVTEGPYRLKGRHQRSDDAACGFEVTDDFERFHQANDIYSRAQWDSRIRSEKAINWFKGMFMPGLGVRKAEGYGVKDFALRNAGWMGTNLVIQRSLAQDRVDGFGDFIRGRTVWRGHCLSPPLAVLPPSGTTASNQSAAGAATLVCA